MIKVTADWILESQTGYPYVNKPPPSAFLDERQPCTPHKPMPAVSARRIGALLTALTVLLLSGSLLARQRPCVVLLYVDFTVSAYQLGVNQLLTYWKRKALASSGFVLELVPYSDAVTSLLGWLTSHLF